VETPSLFFFLFVLNAFPLLFLVRVTTTPDSISLVESLVRISLSVAITTFCFVSFLGLAPFEDTQQCFAVFLSLCLFFPCSLSSGLDAGVYFFFLVFPVDLSCGGRYVTFFRLGTGCTSLLPELVLAVFFFRVPIFFFFFRSKNHQRRRSSP